MSHEPPPSDWFGAALNAADATIVAVVVAVTGAASILWGGVRVFIRLEVIERRQDQSDKDMADLKADIREDLGELKAGMRLLTDALIKRERLPTE